MGIASLLVYPNPSSNALNILFEEDNSRGDYTFQVYDVGGRLLQMRDDIIPNQPYSINVNGFANGMYFVDVLSGNNVVGRGRFVKE